MSEYDEKSDLARLLGFFALGFGAAALALPFLLGKAGDKVFLSALVLAGLGIAISVRALDLRRVSPEPKPGSPIAGAVVCAVAAALWGLAWLLAANIRHI